jgi:hypothetical protein
MIHPARFTLKKLVFCLVIGGALAGLTGATASAQSSPSPSPTPVPATTPNPGPAGAPAPFTNTGAEHCDSQGRVEIGDVGLQSLLALPCIRGNNQPTLYEKYSSSAYQIHASKSNVLDPALWADSLRNVIASWIMDLMTGLGSLCAALLEWVFALELAGGLNSQLNASGLLGNIVTGLGNNIYKPFFITSVTVAGLYVVWFGVLKKRMMITLQSAGWVLLAASVAAFFLAAPNWAVGSLDGISLYASRLVLSTVSQVDPDISNTQYQGIYNQDPGKRDYAGLRAAINRYWQVYVYKPWEAAEFGSIDFAEQKAPNGMTWAEWDLQSNSQGDQAKQQFESAVLAQLDSSGQSQLKDWYNGVNAGPRVAMLGLGFVAAALATILLVLIAGAVIMAQLGLVLLTMVAPLFFLVGIHPGTGRRIFIRWGELMLGFLVRRVLYSAFLAVILVFGGLIIGGVGAQSWLLASALQIGLVVAALWFRKPIAALFTQVGAGKLDHLIAPQREMAWATAKENTWGRLKRGVAAGVRQHYQEGQELDESARESRRYRQDRERTERERRQQQSGGGDRQTAGPPPGERRPQFETGPQVESMPEHPQSQPVPALPAASELEERRLPDEEKRVRRQEQREKARQLGAGAVAATTATGGTAALGAGAAAAAGVGGEQIDRAREKLDEGTERVVKTVVSNDPNRGGPSLPPKSTDDWDRIRSKSRPALLEDGDE